MTQKFGGLMAALILLLQSPSFSQSSILNDSLVYTIKVRNYTAAMRLLDKGADPNYIHSYSVKNSKSNIDVPNSPFAIFLLPAIVINALVPAGSTTYREAPLQELLDHPDTSDTHYLLLQKLLEKGADPDREVDGKLPLIQAVDHYDWRAIKLLVEAGADLQKYSGGYTPVEKAVTNNQWAIVEYFFEARPELEGDRTIFNNALLTTLKEGKLSAARTLISLGALPTADYNQKNVLHYWAAGEAKGWSNLYFDTINAWIPKLTALGMDINQRDIQGNTPLIVAMEKQDYTIVYLLLNAGADPNARNNENETALHKIVKVEKPSMYLIEMLLKYGADKNLANNNGETAGDYAAKTWNKALIEKLEPELEPKKKRTLALVDEFIKLRSDTAYTEQKAAQLIYEGVYDYPCFQELTRGNYLDPCTFLSCAVRADYKQIAVALLETGADPNLQDPASYDIPLCELYKTGDTALGSILVEFGADPGRQELLSDFNFYDGYDNCDTWTSFCAVNKFLLHHMLNGYITWTPYEGKYFLDAGAISLIEEPVEQYTPFDSNGYCFAKKNGKWGLLRVSGKWENEAQFDSIYYLREFRYEGETGWHTTPMMLVSHDGKLCFWEPGTHWKTGPEFDRVYGYYTNKKGTEYIVVESAGSYFVCDYRGYKQYPVYDDIREHKGKLQGLTEGKWKKVKY